MSRAAAATPIIERVGVLCPIGRGSRQVYASVRAALSRTRLSPAHDRRYESIRLSLFPDDEIEPLAESIEQRMLPPRLRRMLQLAGPALREAVADPLVAGHPLPLFIGIPEARPGDVALPPAQFITLLSEQTRVPLDAGASQSFARGRAAALLALGAGVRFLAQRPGEAVLVGGLDSYLDPRLLSELDREERILGDRVSDGFIPGEGAAFLLLTSGRHRGSAAAQPATTVLGVGEAEDPGHRYSDHPARGEGLALAMERMLSTLPRPPEPIGTTFAGFNGENFGAKEWGVARLRYGDLFTPGDRIEHPADCFGDAGAALGALLLALAHTALARGHRGGPALVFASSDREDRACALLERR